MKAERGGAGVTASELARHLDMRNLILAHRNHVGTIDQDVGRHHDRIAEEAEVRQVAVDELLLLFA